MKKKNKEKETVANYYFGMKFTFSHKDQNKH